MSKLPRLKRQKGKGQNRDKRIDQPEIEKIGRNHQEQREAAGTNDADANIKDVSSVSSASRRGHGQRRRNNADNSGDKRVDGEFRSGPVDQARNEDNPSGDAPERNKDQVKRRRNRNWLRRREKPRGILPLGSENGAGGGENVAGSSAHQTSHRQIASADAPISKPKKRRRKNRSLSNVHNGIRNGIRNVRAPVQPTPPAAFNGNSDAAEPANMGSEQALELGQASSLQRGNRHWGARQSGADTSNSGTSGNGNPISGTANSGSFKSHSNMQPLYAALDLGTNNCRLLIAYPQEKGSFRVIDGFSRIVRLGEGLAHSGRLSEAAMDRAVEALEICSSKLANYAVKGQRLIATEACRQAENGQEFLDRVKKVTGLDLEIIDRKTEAHLAAEGCGALMDRMADAAVLFDIGGGSSELVLVNRLGGRKKISEQIVSWISVPIGVVTLAERHGGQLVTGDSFRAMIAEVKAHLDQFEGRNALARIWKNGKVHLLGTSGTVTTLAGIHLGLPKYERRKVDGLWMNAIEVDSVIRDLLAMDYRQRAANPCIGMERADLVMAGCAILEAIRQTWPSDRLRVADRGLREGMLTLMMDADQSWRTHRFQQVARRSSFAAENSEKSTERGSNRG